MAMAIEEYVRKRGRATQVKQVREKINQLGIDYIYYQFISVTGRIVGKGDAGRSLGNHRRERFPAGLRATVANLYVDRYGHYIGYGPESSELVGIPDPETFVQLPWDKRVARVYCTCFRNREEKRGSRRLFDIGLPRQPRRLHDEFKRSTRACTCARHRAGNDVAEERRGRPAQWRLLEAELLSHRPVRKPAPGLHEGHRIFAAPWAST